MIDQIISDLKHTKRDIENEFKGWFKFATDMAAPVGVVLALTVRVTTVCQLLFL